MIWFLLAVALAALIYYKCIKPMSYWKNLGVQQTKPWPLFGDSWRSIFRRVSLSEAVLSIYNTYPNSRYFGAYQLAAPIIVLRDPELIKQMLVKDFDHFTDHSTFIDPDADPLWSGNLFSLKGQKWREMRATLSGSFTSSKMKSMFHLMIEAAENFTQFFLDKNEDIIEIEMKDIYTRYTNDVIATAAFGIKCDSLSQPNNEFYSMGKQATNLSGFKMALKIVGYLLMPKLFRLFKFPLFEKKVSTFFRNIIDETIKIREEQGIVRPDMIHLLLEARKGIKHEENEAVDTGFATVKESTDVGKFKQLRYLTNEDITAQAIIFFFAGFDTISSALCFGSHELVSNKEVQDKLREEIIITYKKSNGKVTYEILLKMKYMDMVVSEILRKWAPQVVVDRVCTKPYTIEPVTPDETPAPLKVGNLIWLPIHAIHRDPAYYPDPEKFDPERFSDENKDNIKAYTYMPFGIGPRNCIGSRFALLEMKALLFNLLLNFEIVPTKKTQIPLKLGKSLFQLTAEGGFWFGLKRIKS